jgi:1,4-alpha-glucan branching enzyme
MNDTLRYMSEAPINRSYHHHTVTFSLMYAFSENFMLPLSHDEVVHGKGSLYARMPGDAWQRIAGLRALYAYQWTHPGKKLLFMGDEIGQESEWSEGRSVDWWHLEDPLHAGLLRLIGDLNRLYRESPPLWERDAEPSGFQWIDADDSARNVISYLRLDSRGEPVAVAANFAGVPHEGFRLGLPSAGAWSEVLNTDAEIYGGSGVGNLGEVIADETPVGGWAHSAPVRLPPLGAVILRPASGS